MIQRYDFAPLDGITKVVFRQVYHRLFGGADRYFIPFFSPTDQHILTKRDQRELDPAANAGLHVVPQVMTRRAPDFLWAAEVVADMGYTEVNLNLGCPSGTVTAKGKGSGMLRDLGALDRFLYTVFDEAGGPISVKTRIGVTDPEEFGPILEVYNRYPLAELIIHPRVMRQLYRGQADRAAFAAALPSCKAPVCYNGDITTPQDLTALEAAWPGLAGLMAGRGLIANPALFRMARGGTAPSKEELRGYLTELYTGYTAAFGSATAAISRMKGFWHECIGLFAGTEKLEKQLRKLREPWEYEVTVDQIFTLPLR